MILQLKDADIAFGDKPLLDKSNLTLEPGERVCLVGRNGTGKSTLLKVIAGSVPLDDGQRLCNSDVNIAVLPQDPPALDQVSVFDYIAEGLQEQGELLKQYHQVLNAVSHDPSDKNLQQLDTLQKQLEAKDAWQFEQRIEQVITQMALNGEASLASLSGGWRRKAALARALVKAPDILLLDEPTNHLDIKMIKWLEEQMLMFKGALVFVSHDRAFIRAIATRIVDLDRGKLVSYPGNYQQYLDRKAEDLAAEETQNALFDKKLSEEEKWIRQGIKARRTRNEGRVRALKAMREEHAQRRNVQGKATITTADAQKSGKLVFDTQGLGVKFDDQVIVRDLTLTLMRKDRLALIGPNGCGKSTLIKALLGELPNVEGSVKRGTNLEIAYFDQHREQLDLSKSVIDVVADGKREITLGGRTKHVISYLQDFLFAPDRVQAPVSSLSGGEKNRLLMAKILSKPSNLLILDEPTNDLDVETLELLEETLCNYEGTLILVSHDREFVDNVVTQSLFFEGNGYVRQFVGGYSDIEDWYSLAQKNVDAVETSDKSKSRKSASSESRNKKLSYKLQLELEQLPQQIESLEAALETIQQQVNDPGFYQQDADSINEVLASLAGTEQQLEEAYARWDELESLKQETTS